jgi:hypothetical protein
MSVITDQTISQRTEITFIDVGTMRLAERTLIQRLLMSSNF